MIMIPPPIDSSKPTPCYNYRRRRKARNSHAASYDGPTRIIYLYSSIVVACMASWVTAFSVVSTTSQRRFSLQGASESSVHSLSSTSSPLFSNNLVLARRRALFSALYSTDSSDESSSDDKEWQAMLAAFKMYKAAYGDLKVPLRFVVPALPPWPKQAWNMKLGQRVAAIRSTGKYVNDEERRKTLDGLGFVWRLRSAKSPKDKDINSDSFDQIYSALVTYRDHVQKGKGEINIPPSFVVPDCDPWPENTRGLPLGRRIATLRSKSFLSANPEAKKKLKAIGFQLDGKLAANDARFQMVYDALKRYKEIYGDLLVPQPFVVPEMSQEWPEDTWGLRLGARVNAIRSQGTFINSNPERKELLDSLGFVWRPPKSESGNRRGRRRKEEIEAMEARKGLMSEPEGAGEGESKLSPTDDSLDSLFGGDFEFDNDSLPIIGAEGGPDIPTWSLEGGSRLQDAARRAEEEAQAAEDYTPPKNLAESLEEAKAKAVEVGVIEIDSDGKRFKTRKREKNIAWFNDDFGNEFVFDDVVEALSVYKSIYGDFSNLTDESFVIPSQWDEFPDFDDPDDMFGNMDSSVRAAAAIARFDEDNLNSGGSVYDEPARGTNVAVSVEASAGDWPEHLGGMHLGNIVKRIRDGSLEVKHLPERKAKLDELGFDWGDPQYFLDVPFEKAMCAMWAYYQVRGDMLVWEDFVMPDEDPYPQALAGYEIGKAVRRIRELQNFFEAYHKEKVVLLFMVDFVWFRTMALPLDPNEAEMTWEHEQLIAFGHPDYKVFYDDWPMDLFDEIMAQGPFWESNDPKYWPRYWWRKWHNWDGIKDYWYRHGSRDNALTLRRMGYPQMGDEHEAKYGPGFFKQMYATLMEVERNGSNDKDSEEMNLLQQKIKFFREEMTNCSNVHPEAAREVHESLDEYIFSLSTGNEVNSTLVEDLEYLLANNFFKLEEDLEKDDEYLLANNFFNNYLKWAKDVEEDDEDLEETIDDEEEIEEEEVEEEIDGEEDDEEEVENDEDFGYDDMNEEDSLDMDRQENESSEMR